MTTLYDSVNTVLKRLDDYPTVSGEQAYTRAEIELYLQDGYNVFCRQTKCILDFYYAENFAQAGNYVATWGQDQRVRHGRDREYAPPRGRVTGRTTAPGEQRLERRRPLGRRRCVLWRSAIIS